ncbi:MAG: glycosyl hydrolase family protein [Balneolaceae bacterium]|nr:MAG: glycosyl hydrolase family protein [Balneolaceae bacterium]
MNGVNMKLYYTGVLIALLGFITFVPVTIQAQNWELIWSDEFDGNELDGSKWSFQYGTGAEEGLSGWGNSELQYYTDRADNIFVQDGRLHIVAQQETYQGMDYTSARIRSIHQGDWRYGRFEIRAKLPTGQGLWPAIWMMPTDDVYGRWPASGEIDIMELVGHEPDVIHGTLHYGPPHTYTGGSYTLENGTFNDDFHTFALEWERGEMRWYVDDVLYLTQTDWFSQGQGFPAPFEQRFHMILNVAVGGNWPGSPDNTTVFPQQMEIDFVRVYRDADATFDVSLPLTFEDLYSNWADAFTGFEGGTVTPADNPAPDFINNSDRVGMMVKDGGAYWGGAYFRTERPFSFNADVNTITMKVWSPRSGVPILIKAEQQNSDLEFETVQTTTASGEWEVITWSVDPEAYNIDWDIITLIFDFEEGQSGDGSEDFIWYFDDLDVYAAITEDPVTPANQVPVTLPLTFENTQFPWNRAFLGFSGGEITTVRNPHPDVLNNSARVGKMVKNGGAFWGGAYMILDDAFVFSEDKHTITMKVWSPRPEVPVLMKMEQRFGVQFYEIAEPTATSQQWEEMTWNMSGAGFVREWDLITLIFDFRAGQVGDGSDNFTWYFDDLVVDAERVGTSVPGHGSDLPVTYELRQNYPNPFNPTTQIQFNLPEQAHVMLEVYNIMGQRVATLANGAFRAGRHDVVFDATGLASGVYLYHLRTPSFSQTQKMLLAK